MARDLSKPPAGWTNRAGSRSQKAWRSLSPSYRRQVLRARERGYESVFKMTRKRAAGELTPSDIAARAEQRTPANRYVVDLSGGRWTFSATVESATGVPIPEGIARLEANMRRAMRLDNNVTGSFVVLDPEKNRTQHKVGGKGGQSARSIMRGASNALDALYRLLAIVYGAEPGRILSVSLFVFPVARGRAA